MRAKPAFSFSGVLSANVRVRSARAAEMMSWLLRPVAPAAALAPPPLQPRPQPQRPGQQLRAHREIAARALRPARAWVAAAQRRRIEELLPAMAAGQMACSERTDVLSQLGNKYKEAPSAAGIAKRKLQAAPARRRPCFAAVQQMLAR